MLYSTLVLDEILMRMHVQMLDGGASILQVQSPRCVQVPENPTERMRQGYHTYSADGSGSLSRRAGRVRADLTFLHRQTGQSYHHHRAWAPARSS